MSKFIPRSISPESAALGYNNEGRGKLCGYISDPKQHEKTCPHFKDENLSCKCRIGLWHETLTTPAKNKKKPKPKNHR